MGAVVACYKWVVDEADIRVRDDRSVDFSRVTRKIGNYDRNAIEAAAAIAGELGGKAIGLTLGDATAKKSMKEALARGLDELVRIDAGERTPADANVTASVLARAIGGIEDVSLVVCAEGSSDLFNRQIPSRIAQLLDMPVVTSVSAMHLVDGKIRAIRTLEDDRETVEVSLPAVVSVLPEAAELHIPTLKQIMAAGKKPQKEVKVADLAVAFNAQTTVENTVGFVNDRKNIVFDAADEDCIDSLIVALRKEGVI